MRCLNRTSCQQDHITKFKLSRHFDDRRNHITLITTLCDVSIVPHVDMTAELNLNSTSFRQQEKSHNTHNKTLCDVSIVPHVDMTTKLNLNSSIISTTGEIT